MGHILTGYYRILMFHCCHENIHTEKYKKPHLHIHTLYMKNITHTHAFKRRSVSLTLQKKMQPTAGCREKRVQPSLAVRNTNHICPQCLSAGFFCGYMDSHHIYI